MAIGLLSEDRKKISFKGPSASSLCKVELEYRNKDLTVVSQRECDLTDYSEILKNSILRLILEAEDLAYKATDGKSKDEWDDDVSASFNRLRHKVLDIANEVGRIPKNLRIEVDAYVPSSPVVQPMYLRGNRNNDNADVHPIERSAFRWGNPQDK